MEAEKLRGKATAHARSNIAFRVAEMELEPAAEKVLSTPTRRTERF